MNNTSDNRRYLPVELPFYEQLNWDMNVIISCLDVFRVKLPLWFKEFPKTAEYDLICLENSHGSSYPAIGIHCTRNEDFNLLPSFINLYDDLERKMTDEMIKEIVNESKMIESISWEELKKIKVYAKPVKYK